MLLRFIKNMEHSSIDKIMKLILLLASEKNVNIDSISNELDVSSRTSFRYIKSLKKAGFSISKTNEGFHLFFENPNLSQLNNTDFFSASEKELFNQIAVNLGKVSDTSFVSLKNKLFKRYFDLEGNFLSNEISQIKDLFDKAIKNKLVVEFSYRSSNSGSTKLRVVEPYQFIKNFRDIVCYEIQSKSNKQFNLSRMNFTSIKIRENSHWNYEDSHEDLSGNTDFTGYSGPNKYWITLLLNTTSYNSLIETYPNSSVFIQQTDDKKWSLSANVYNYEGIGRYVLSLPEDVEVINSPDFVQYLKNQIKKYTF